VTLVTLLRISCCGSCFLVCHVPRLLVCHSESSGGVRGVGSEGPADSGHLGSLPAVQEQRGDPPLTATGDGRRSGAGVGQGKAQAPTV